MEILRLIMIVISVSLCSLPSWQLSGPARAELIPALEKIPEGLPVDVKERLSKRRQELAKELQKFIADAEKFMAIPAGQQSKAEFEALENRRSHYIKAAKEFKQEVNAAKWLGDWTKKEKEKVLAALGRLKDAKIKKWIDVEVVCERSKEPREQSLTSPFAGLDKLIFTDTFFSKNTTDARRDNLIAFEAGKVVWNMKEYDPEFKKWWSLYQSTYSSVISNMAKAKYREEDLSNVFDPSTEGSSGFGYVFRAIALKLHNPKGQSSQQEWDNAIREFRGRFKGIFQRNQ